MSTRRNVHSADYFFSIATDDGEVVATHSFSGPLIEWNDRDTHYLTDDIAVRCEIERQLSRGDIYHRGPGGHLAISRPGDSDYTTLLLTILSYELDRLGYGLGLSLPLRDVLDLELRQLAQAGD